MIKKITIIKGDKSQTVEEKIEVIANKVNEIIEGLYKKK